MDLVKEILDKYTELKKLCPPHTLLTLVNVAGNKFIPTDDFKFVYALENEQANLSDYLADLNCALEHEYKLRRELKF